MMRMMIKTNRINNNKIKTKTKTRRRNKPQARTIATSLYTSTISQARVDSLLKPPPWILRSPTTLSKLLTISNKPSKFTDSRDKSSHMLAQTSPPSMRESNQPYLNT